MRTDGHVLRFSLRMAPAHPRGLFEKRNTTSRIYNVLQDFGAQAGAGGASLLLFDAENDAPCAFYESNSRRLRAF